MTTRFQVLDGVLGVFFWMLILVGLTLIMLFERRLKRAHRGAWEELGSPSLILNNTSRNLFMLLRFLWSGRYRELGDRSLDALGGGLRLLQLVGCIFAGGSLIFVVAARAG